MADEVKRWYIWNETDGTFYFSMKLFKGWWYLRILRWMRMTTLRWFLMRWFYEPFFAVYFTTDLGSQNTASEEEKRQTISAEETKRFRITTIDEAKRNKITVNDEAKRVTA